MSSMGHTRIDWAEGVPLTAGPYFLGLYQPSPETEGFWKGVERGELLVKWCEHCKATYHPKRIVCTRCGGTDLSWKQSSGRGKVYSFSEVHHAAIPAFKASVPYTIGMVELEERVYLFTRFIPDPGPVAIDAPARVDFRVLETDQVLPVFLVGAR